MVVIRGEGEARRRTGVTTAGSPGSPSRAHGSASRDPDRRLGETILKEPLIGSGTDVPRKIGYAVARGRSTAWVGFATKHRPFTTPIGRNTSKGFSDAVA